MRLSIFFRDGLVCCAKTAGLWIRISCQEHDIKLFHESNTSQGLELHKLIDNHVFIFDVFFFFFFPKTISLQSSRNKHQWIKQDFVIASEVDDEPNDIVSNPISRRD
jgi:hypothetical protein